MPTAGTSTIIPHPPIVWEQVRTVDMLFLLGLGATTELIFRCLVFMAKRKPAFLRQKENYFFKLEWDTKLSQAKGPTAFVETSKLERQLLAADKELQKLYEVRQAARGQAEKYFLKYGRNIVALIVFILYYGIPIVSFSGGSDGLVQLDQKVPAIFQRAILFPLSFVGFGFKVSKWGMGPEDAMSGIGALVVMWSASTFVGQLMDGVEHMLLS